MIGTKRLFGSIAKKSIGSLAAANAELEESKNPFTPQKKLNFKELAESKNESDSDGDEDRL